MQYSDETGPGVDFGTVEELRRGTNGKAESVQEAATVGFVHGLDLGLAICWRMAPGPSAGLIGILISKTTLNYQRPTPNVQV